MAMMGDYVSFGECRLKNLRTVDVRKNNEKVGEKTLIDIVTWGDSYTAEVDLKYAETLPTGQTGRAYVQADLEADKQIRKFAGDAYNKDIYVFSSLKLVSFEVGK